MPHKQPDQACDQHRKVEQVVIQVEELNEQRMWQKDALNGRLARHLEYTLDMPDPASPAERSAGAHEGKGAGVLPERKQPHDERGFLGKERSWGQPRLVSCPQRRTRERQARRGAGGLAPAQFEVDHLRRPARVGRWGTGRMVTRPRLRPGGGKTSSRRWMPYPAQLATARAADAPRSAAVDRTLRDNQAHARARPALARHQRG